MFPQATLFIVYLCIPLYGWVKWSNSNRKKIDLDYQDLIKMAEIQLKQNQAALILETSEEGEITVNVASCTEDADANNFASSLCQVIAQKLISDEAFQAEILSELE